MYVCGEIFYMFPGNIKLDVFWLFLPFNMLPFCSQANLLSSHRSLVHRVETIALGDEPCDRGEHVTLFLFNDCLEVMTHESELHYHYVVISDQCFNPTHLSVKGFKGFFQLFLSTWHKINEQKQNMTAVGWNQWYVFIIAMNKIFFFSHCFSWMYARMLYGWVLWKPCEYLPAR